MGIIYDSARNLMGKKEFYGDDLLQHKKFNGQERIEKEEERNETSEREIFHNKEHFRFL